MVKVKSGDITDADSNCRKIKNLPKAKNVKKLAKFKQPDSTKDKDNKTFRIGFFYFQS